MGVSRSTVSRALSGYPHVDERLRKQIIETATEMGYCPNQAARLLAKSETVPIGVVLYAKKDQKRELLQEYMNDILCGVNLAYRQLAIYGLTVETEVTDINHPEEQIAALESMAAKGVRGVAVAPCDPDILVPTIDKLMGQGIQVLLLNTDVPQSSRLCYVGSDYVQAGRISAGLVGRYLRGTGRVAPIIFADKGTMTSQKLTGFREEIGRYPGIGMMGPCRFSRTGEHVYEDTVELIKSQRPDAIFMTYGQLEDVAKAVEDTGMANRMVVVGFDYSTGVFSYLRRRVITAVIGQEPARQGRVAVKILFDYFAHGDLPRSSVVHARLEIITDQNYPYYQKDVLNVSNYYYV